MGIMQREGDFDLEPDILFWPELPPDNGEVGVASLEARFGDKPEALALNASAGLVSSLRALEPAMATGHDTKIVGVESRELLTGLLDKMTMPDSRIGFRSLMEFFVSDFNLPYAKMHEILTAYSDAIRTHRATFAGSVQKRYEEIDSLRPMTTQLLRTAERFVDLGLDNGVRLPYEGGDPDFFDPDLLHDICDPYYLNEDTISGQVRQRLMMQARAMSMVEPSDFTPA